MQGAEKLHAQTLWGERRDQSIYLLSSNYMSDMCPCSALDHHSGSNWGLKLSKTTLLVLLNLLICANAAEIDTYTQKFQVAGRWSLLPHQSSSESTGDV